MRRIKVTHFLQDPAHCAVAASSVIANHYNKKVDYSEVKKIAYKKISKKIPEVGLDSAEICLLLSQLGFKKITLVTSDLSVWDYSWKKFGNRKLIETLKESYSKKEEKEEKEITKSFIKWLSLKDNKKIVKISYDFGRYIRSAIKKGKPIILTFNWTMFFEYEKENHKGVVDTFNGCGIDHAVVVNGFDKNGVWIVDSHHEYYKYSRKKYKRGFYKMKWEHLFTCMGQGDVIIPDDYGESD